MLYGDRIRLRAIERDDIPAFLRWFNDPEVRQYMATFAPLSRVQEERWFEALLDRKDDYLYAIEVQVNKQWVHIGNVGLHGIDWRNRSAHFAIVIGEKESWSRGYGSDAARTMLRFAFETLNLHRVELEVYAFNARAIRSYEKVGFQREGVRRESHFRDGRYHDAYIMSILQTEFMRQSSSQPATPNGQ